MMFMNEVLLVGSYPPPYGGCSVHIQRLQNCLADRFFVKALDMYSESTDQDVLNNVYRCGRRKPFNLIKAFFVLAKSNAGLIHFHAAAMNNFLFAGFLLLLPVKRGIKKIISIHSGSFVKNFTNTAFLKKILLKTLLKKFDHIITVSTEQKKMLVDFGISDGRITVAPAFLPPIARASVKVMQSLAELRKNGSNIIVSSGYALSYYGFHKILDAVCGKNDFIDSISVVFCFYNTYDTQYLEDIESRLINVKHLVFKDLDPDEFSYILSQSDIYIRATDRDGDAVAIREAAFFGKNIIASDCVERPSGTVLFDVDNAFSLESALLKVLHDKNAGVVKFDYDDNLRKINYIYNNLLNTGVDNETNITKS